MLPLFLSVCLVLFDLVCLAVSSDVCLFAARTSVYGFLRCAPAYGVLRRATLSRHPQRPFGPNNELPPSSCRAPTTTVALAEGISNAGLQKES